MKKCALILPYFGTFKDSFQLFLASCKRNLSIDWFVITDSSQTFDYPENVHLIKMSFESLREKFQNKFDWPIVLDRPYKLCDYKPAYGYLFADMIRDFEYWGYCDCDVIWGDLNSLLLPLLDRGYDKLFAAGHLTIYRNTDKNNSIFLQSDPQVRSLAYQAFSSSKSFAFDEMYFIKNIHTLFLNSNANIYEHDLSYNIATKFFYFHRCFFETSKHEWRTKSKLSSDLILLEDGHLYQYNPSGTQIEYLYVHFQNRKLNWKSKQHSVDRVLITPFGFYSLLPQESVTKVYRSMKCHIGVKHRIQYSIVYLNHKVWAFRDRNRSHRSPYKR